MLAAVLFFPNRANAVSAEKALVLDALTGRVIYEKNADQQSLIASTTKIMTALIICEQCNVLDRMRIPKEAVGIEGSSMYLKEGEILTIQELLYGLMLHSGNDAAVALARENGCYNVTLNVWSCNPSALRFYERMGMVPQKICMEKIFL